MEIYLRGKLIVPTRPYDLMYERRKYILPQQKFRSLSKQKAAALKEKKKKIEKKVRDAKGKVSHRLLRSTVFGLKLPCLHLAC